MIDPHRLRLLRARSLLQSALVLGAIGLLLALIGWSVAGPVGIIWGLMGGVAALVIQPRLSVPVLRRIFRAREVGWDDAPRLYGLLAEIAKRAGLARPPRLFYMPSPAVQALAFGGGDRAVVGVTDGLVRTLPPRELAGVLAHEIGHIRNHDLRLLELASAASRLTNLFSNIGLILVVIDLPLLLTGKASLPPGFLLLLIFAPMVSALLQLTLSRTREYDADASAVELTGDPDGLAAALVRLDQLQGGMWEEAFTGRRANWLARLLRTHPDTSERVARLRALSPRAGGPPLALPEHPFGPFDGSSGRVSRFLGLAQRYWR